MQATTVLIVDDDAGFRRHIEEFLASEPGIQIVGEASDGQEAVEKATALEPDVVLMDVRMAGTSGLGATRQIKERQPEACIIMLSRFDLKEYRDAAQTSGASDYIVKKAMLEELGPAIRRATRSQPSANGIQHGPDRGLG